MGLARCGALIVENPGANARLRYGKPIEDREADGRPAIAVLTPPTPVAREEHQGRDRFGRRDVVT